MNRAMSPHGRAEASLAPPSPPRSPWQFVYGAAHRARRAWYRRRAERLPRPVVSVGNLHWGGGGKTPLVAAVAAHLRDAGHRVAILSRGYGRDSTGIRVVSDGGPPLVGPGEAGDEPFLLSEQLPGVAVVVGAERAAAGRHALEHLASPPDLFLLDDGFSHLALHRDLDLLAFPAADPFAGGRLFPGGRLREPLASCRHADAALLTGLAPEVVAQEEVAQEGTEGSAKSGAGAGAGRRKAEALAAALGEHGFEGAAFACALEAAALRRVDDGDGDDSGSEVGSDAGSDAGPLAAGTRLLPVCAIARPGGFLAGAAAAAAAAGLELAPALTFRDHHDYPPASLEEIRRAAAAAGAGAVVTTAKDRVKLHRRHLGLALVELPVRARPEAAFWAWLDGRLEPLLRRGKGAG